VVEGGYVATCRHVWRDAGEPTEVEIEFPFLRENGVVVKQIARLADLCEGLVDPLPDVVLLKPDAVPSGIMLLQLAAHDGYETGPGQVHAFLLSRGIDDFVEGEIAKRVNAKGQRNFTGNSSTTYWFEKGSSGSPVFVENGQQLAGILALSEVGSKQGQNPLHEAFVVPATTIRVFLMRLAAAPVAKAQGITADELRPILERLGAREAPIAEIPKLLMQFVEAAQARGAEPVPASNDGADIDAAPSSASSEGARGDRASLL